MKNTNDPIVKEISEKWFIGKTAVYIDYANLVGAQGKTGWRIDISKLKHFFSLFPQVETMRFYYGLLEGEKSSEQFINQVKKFGFETIIKPVKLIKKSIDVSGTDVGSPAILKNFIRNTLIRILDVETIEFLNSKLLCLNKSGKLFLLDRKCNFDVEISVDMALDFDKYDTFVLLSGDSDFADLIKRFRVKGKRILVFAHRGTIASEIFGEGAKVFDLSKLRNHLCWNKDKLKP